MTPTTRIPLGTPVRARSGAIGIVSAHSTISGRVEFRRWQRGMGWLVGRWVEAGSLTVISTAVEAEEAA